MIAANSNYQVRRATYPRDRDTVIDLWKGNLGESRSGTEKFAWFYENGPTGEPLTMLLAHCAGQSGETWDWAGVATAGPRQWLLDDKPVEAGVLVDMTVTAAHRTLFPALTLQKALRTAGLERWQILYGFPNPKAAPVFARVGYQKLGKIVRYARVLRSAKYLTAKLPAPLVWLLAPLVDGLLQCRLGMRGGLGKPYHLRWGLLHEASLDAKSNTLPAGQSLARGHRDVPFLRWRFADRGELRFEFVSIEDKAQQQQGWWVVCAMGPMLCVCDCSISLLRLPDAYKAWIQLGNQARRKGFHSLSFACLAPEPFIETLRRADLLAREDRPVFVATNGMVQPLSWFVTAADEDE